MAQVLHDVRGNLVATDTGVCWVAPVQTIPHVERNIALPATVILGEPEEKQVSEWKAIAEDSQ
jgi:hypothetical protein